MARKDPQVSIRLPPDVKRFIAGEARVNASSQNSEIVRAIRARMAVVSNSQCITNRDGEARTLKTGTLAVRFQQEGERS
ncbi:MAG: Arc family DNA-binding protein [Mesorhizobium sp.]